MKNKVILDEMQQKTLLEIEHKTLHIALTGLLIVILMQQIFWKDGQNTLGEAAVLLISSGYLLLSYIKNGIWDRTKPFSAKTNRVISLLVSLAMGIFLGVTNQLRYHDPLSSVLTFVISFLCSCCWVFSLPSSGSCICAESNSWTNRQTRRKRRTHSADSAFYATPQSGSTHRLVGRAALLFLILFYPPDILSR